MYTDRGIVHNDSTGLKPRLSIPDLSWSFGENLEWKVRVRGYDSATKVWYNTSLMYLCPKFQYTLEVS